MSAVREPRRASRLQEWLVRNAIPSARLEAKLRERLQGRAPSRQQVLRWRRHGVDMRRKDMVRVLWAAREISNDHNLQLQDLFNVDPGSDEIWMD
jgi:hypothetical protein